MCVVKKRLFLLALILAAAGGFFYPASLAGQKLPARVLKAKQQKDVILRALFEGKDLPYPPKRIYIRAFKREQLLELWALDKKGTAYELAKTFDFCTSSGVLGPKRRQGDLQIPEGFYFIDRFNAWSNFYLSLGINYPNRSDRIRGSQKNPGGDIFIHGSCVTIGCIPITNEKIKELYWLAHLAREQGQGRIPVHIFPAKMSDDNMKKLAQTAQARLFWTRFKALTGSLHPKTAAELIAFWQKLKQAYDHFQNNKQLPKITIARDGAYTIESR